MKKFFRLLSLILALAGCERAEAADPSSYNVSEWTKQLRDSSLTEEQFTKLMAQALAAKAKGAKVQITGPREISLETVAGGKIKCFLDNAWTEAKENPADRPAICERYIKDTISSLDQMSQPPAPLDTNSIVVVVRNDQFMENFKESAGTSNQVVSEPLVADIRVLYASDSDSGIVYLSEANRQKLGMDLPSLRKLALKNVQRLLPNARLDGTGPVYMYIADGNYESSLLLSDKLCEDAASRVEGDIVAAVPARDMLIFTGSRSPDGIKLLKEAVDRVYTGNHLISKTLLVRRNGHWEKYKD